MVEAVTGSFSVLAFARAASRTIRMAEVPAARSPRFCISAGNRRMVARAASSPVIFTSMSGIQGRVLSDPVPKGHRATKRAVMAAANPAPPRQPLDPGHMPGAIQPAGAQAPKPHINEPFSRRDSLAEGAYPLVPHGRTAQARVAGVVQLLPPARRHVVVPRVRFPDQGMTVQPLRSVRQV